MEAKKDKFKATIPLPPKLSSSRELGPLRIAIVGGGDYCHRLLKKVCSRHIAALRIEIVGIADEDKDAPGLSYAHEKGIFTTTNYRELSAIEGLDLILELSGSQQILEELWKSKPPTVSILDQKASEVLLNLILLASTTAQSEAISEAKRHNTQKILDSLPYRIMVVNKDMSISTINQTFLREKDLTSEQVIGKCCHEIRYGLDKPCSEYGRPCYLEEVKQKKEIISTIHEIKDENGQERYEVITVSPILDDSGEITQLLEASRDVTDRIKLEREVERSNTFFQNLIQSVVDGIVVVDTKGNVLIFNEGMERLTGYSASEIMEKGHISSFYDIEVAKENMRKMRSDQYGPPGKLQPTSMTIKNKSGEEIPVTLSASIITIDGKEVGSVGVFTDMREILKMRKELEDAHLQLVQSEKIASVGRMAAGVAHEINNPLSGILIYAELLKEQLKDIPQALNDIQEIITQTLRCKKIVSELLEFSRQSVGKLSSFSLGNLIDKCLGLLVNQAMFQDIEVVKDIQPDMPDAIGDMGQLQQVFTNLFINAADAMEGKGRLRVQARYDKERCKFIINVSDTGPGIPEELRGKIFDIFFTTKPVGKGTGLGLSISQNIINLHGGSISFSCPPEGGTTFTIELPLEYQDRVYEQPVFIGMDGS